MTCDNTLHEESSATYLVLLYFLYRFVQISLLGLHYFLGNGCTSPRDVYPKLAYLQSFCVYPRHSASPLLDNGNTIF
jgi:hypothetical protein